MSLSFLTLQAIKEAEAKALAETLLVEPFTKCEVNTIAEVLAQHLELDKYKLTTSLISENIAPSKYASALFAVRNNTVAGAVLLITETLKDVTEVIDIYTKNNTVYVYLTDCDRYLTADEYLSDIGTELCLDLILKDRSDPEREYLEELAKTFAPCLGWNFSGPISATAPEITLFQAQQPHTVKPYYGFKHNSTRFDTSLRVFKDQYIEYVDESIIETVTMSKKTKLLKTQGVPTAELKSFEEYFSRISKKLKHYMEPDLAICKCGYPIRTVGSVDNACCQYCGTEIPDYYCEDLGMDYKLYKIYQIAEANKSKGYEYVRDLLKDALK